MNIPKKALKYMQKLFDKCNSKNFEHLSENSYVIQFRPISLTSEENSISKPDARGRILRAVHTRTLFIKILTITTLVRIERLNPTIPPHRSTDTNRYVRLDSRNLVIDLKKGVFCQIRTQH